MSAEIKSDQQMSPYCAAGGAREQLGSDATAQLAPSPRKKAKDPPAYRAETLRRDAQSLRAGFTAAGANAWADSRGPNLRLRIGLAGVAE
jgi:hypothetical protein